MDTDDAVNTKPRWAWATQMVVEFENSGGVGPLSVDAFSRLAEMLIAVREFTLRQAAVEAATAAMEGRSVSVAVHALIGGQEPKGGA